MEQFEHVHDFVFVEEWVEGAVCCFGYVPCTHCGNCITGSGNHDFDPAEPDGKLVSRYVCSICGKIRDVES